jgi:hypothetical protein
MICAHQYNSDMALGAVQLAGGRCYSVAPPITAAGGDRDRPGERAPGLASRANNQARAMAGGPAAAHRCAAARAPQWRRSKTTLRRRELIRPRPTTVCQNRGAAGGGALQLVLYAVLPFALSRRQVRGHAAALGRDDGSGLGRAEANRGGRGPGGRRRCVDYVF